MTRSVGAKLFLVVLLVLVLSLGTLGLVNVRLHRQHLEAARRSSALRLADVIQRSTSHYMLRNDRAGLRHIVETVGKEPGITLLRIVDANGRVAYTTGAIGAKRVLPTTTPIPNAPSCSNAACHAHPASQRVLGVLKLDLDLAEEDRNVRASSIQFIAQSAGAIVLTLVAISAFLWRFILRPVRTLRNATERLSRGELGVQIPVRSRDELGNLAASFNSMSRELDEARQRQMIHAEKLTSLGKLAAVVAHEINNPLSGILTYARLMRKWVDRGDDLEKKSGEIHEALQLIESESRRCGDIVRSLLTFAREQPLNISDVDVNHLVNQCIRLVEHKLELGNIVADLDLAATLPKIRGDAGQIEQLLLALIMNAIEAMPHEGVLRVTTASRSAGAIAIEIEDNGIGIPAEIRDRLFVPFTTTKEDKGVGLGLAVSKAIVDRHHGTIAVDSEEGRGTKFSIVLPIAEVRKEAA
jgi:two-component system NtrC family sensor kinase